MNDDLDTDWATIRGLPKAPIALGEDLTDDWLELRNIPKVFYYVVKGFGLESMAVKRLLCKGSVRRDTRRGGDAYVGVLDRVLWAGPRYTEHPSMAAVATKNYNYSKRLCDLTPEEVIVRFNHYREGHLNQSRLNIGRWEESLADLQRSVIDAKATLAKFEAFDISKALAEKAPLV